LRVADQTVRLESPGGYLLVEELGAGRRRLEAVPDDGSAFVAERVWETSYPMDLIRLILRIKGLQAVCDEIRREEDPDYLQRVLSWTLLAHVDVNDVGNGRILDFGCGGGSSTMILSRMFPDVQIVGVDIDPETREIAEARREHFGVARAEFRLSPDATGVPDDLGEYDFIVFSALFEHLLPPERVRVIPAVWSHLKPGGLLFLAETPHRYSPIEIHTTGGLPLVNYLPAPLALHAARRFSNRIEAEATWPQLLRRGMRGGTEREFMGYLRKAGYADASIERPSKLGLRDEFDLWYEISHVNELPGFKARLRTAFRILRRISGVSFTPYLAFAVRRQTGHSRLPPRSPAAPDDGSASHDGG
jgi:2-polyprenyl-3-methyl-5-hydroxy-6-metoxy-1,4-benzoquinol methylase